MAVSQSTVSIGTHGKGTQEITDLPFLFQDTVFFDQADVTAEDEHRTKMIKDNVRRDVLKSEVSEDDFIRSLDLQMDVFLMQDQHVQRVTQLINKTNQFNLTTIRRTQDDVVALSKREDTLVLGMSLTDRFGDYGLVGVAILVFEKDVCVIDTFLMSCRVLGRRAETAFLHGVSAFAKQHKCGSLNASFIPTLKNKPAQNMLPDHGFSYDESGDIWRFDMADQTFPDHGITLNIIDNI